MVKLGGSVLDQNGLIENIYEDISLLRMVGAKVVLVHGGGKKISAALSQHGLKTRFISGYRVTDKISMETVSYTHLDVYKRQVSERFCRRGLETRSVFH